MSPSPMTWLEHVARIAMSAVCLLAAAPVDRAAGSVGLRQPVCLLRMVSHGV
ncbi:MAG: hypothetical protein IPK83_17115 [Planctomycetes bacterium]|nr:hypothetical protein [Planctomycetota bacterium]